MSESPNKLSRFYQELKRRRVLKVLAMYAASAFIFLDVLDVITAFLELPGWTSQLIIILLSIGFVITAILAWIYDITPQGWKRTESREPGAEQDEDQTPSKRRFRISDAVIVVLLVVVCLLAYPRVFRNKANLKVMTTSITYKNEFGDKESMRIFKDEFIERLMLFMFEDTDDNIKNTWMSTGITDLTRESLIQFNYMITTGLYGPYYTTRLNEQLETARSEGYPYFLRGSYMVNDEVIEISSQIYQSSDGSLKAERVFEGRDLATLIDSISLNVRKDMGIPAIVLNSSPDSPIRELMTDNNEALRYGAIWFGRDSGFYYVNKALEIDSTYAMAYSERANQLYTNSRSKESAKELISQAVRHRHRLSYIRDLQTRSRYYRIIGEEEKAIDLVRIIHEMQPSNPQYLVELVNIYNQNFLMEEMGKALKKLIKLVPDNREYELGLVRSYLYTGKLDKGLKILDKILKIDPDNSQAIMRKGEFFLHKNDLESAKESFEKAILLSPEKEAIWSPMLEHIEYIKNNPDFRSNYKPFIGTYRLEGSSDPSSEMTLVQSLHRGYMIGKSVNMTFDILYPITDTSVHCYLSPSTTSLEMNQEGKVIKSVLVQSYQSHVSWKEDSMIIRSLKQLDNSQYQVALESFRNAYEENPKHFYLANYINHLKLILNEGYDPGDEIYDSFLGTYGRFNMKLYRKNNRFYTEDHQGLIYELLPMSENRFMIPSYLNRHIQIVTDADSVSGLKYLFSNGYEQVLSRND